MRNLIALMESHSRANDFFIIACSREEEKKKEQSIDLSHGLFNKLTEEIITSIKSSRCVLLPS